MSLSWNELPKVGIVYNYANASDLPAKALVDAGYDGIVSAGVVMVTEESGSTPQPPATAAFSR